MYLKLSETSNDCKVIIKPLKTERTKLGGKIGIDKREIKIIPRSSKFMDFALRGNNDNGDLSIAKNCKFMCLLEQTRAPLGEASFSILRLCHSHK